MTRKDFVLIAEAIQEAKRDAISYPFDCNAQEYYSDGVDTAAKELANALARTNSRFDKERFLKACGVQS